MKCKFSDNCRNDEVTIRLDEQDVPKSERFKYLDSIIQNYNNINGDMNYKIQVRWMKWRRALGILCDRTISLHLKGKFYKTTVRPTLLYGTKCCAIKQQEQKMIVAEIRILRWMCGKNRRVRIINEEIRNKLRVNSIVDKMRECRLKWFGHIQRKPKDAQVKRTENLNIEDLVKRKDNPLKI